jgi:flagellar biosynthesis/type III secretory pathway M-ring protein FliF/YscJ
MCKEQIELPWWKRTWLWLRRWGWVPFGFVLLVLGFLVGGFVFRRREDGKMADPLSDIKEAVQRNNEQIDAEIAAAETVRDEQIRRIEEEHQEQIATLTEDQEQRRQQLRRNPRRMARWLTNLARGE